jgi:hypothetical protein
VSPFNTPYDLDLKNVYEKILCREVEAFPETPVIDGKIDDQVWKNIPEATDFCDLTPDITELSSPQTSFKLLYDDHNLYLAAICRSSSDVNLPEEALPRDNELWKQDHIELFIMPDTKKADKYYQLAVSQCGALWDATHRIICKNKDLKKTSRKTDISWNPNWKVVTRKHNGFWTAEMSVPFKDMGAAAPSPGAKWKFNIGRKHKHLSSMSIMPKMRFQDMEYFGTISFCDKNEKIANNAYRENLKEYNSLKEKQKEFINQDVYVFDYAFDLGTGKTRKNFTTVRKNSLYNKNTQYGWKSNHGLYEADFKPQDHCGYKSSLNNLTRDYVGGKKDAEFIVNLPNGKYQIWIIAGDAKIVPPEFDVIAEGKTKVKVKIPDSNIFNLYSFVCDVRDQKLNLLFKGDYGFLVNGIIVYKKAASIKASAQIERIKQEILLGAPDWVSHCQRYEYKEDNKMPETSSLDRQRGFLIFGKNYLETIYPNTIPKKSELKEQFSISAAAGEYEPVSFGILPLKNIKNLDIQVSDLFNENKEKIDNVNIEVNVVSCKYEKLLDYRSYKYMLLPTLLESFKKMGMSKGIATQIWLNVKVPENTAPGLYNGDIKIKSDSGSECKLNLGLNVYPFELDELEGFSFGVYYSLPGRSLKRGVDGWSRVYKDLVDMKKHNMTAVAFFVPHPRDSKNYGLGKRGNMKADEILKFSRLGKKAGLTEACPFGLQQFLPFDVIRPQKVYDIKPEDWNDLKNSIIRLRDKRLEEDLPELLFYAVDEPHWFLTRQKNALNILKFLKKIDDIRTFMTCTPQNTKLFPWLDVIALQGGTDAEKIKKQNKNSEIWAYNTYTSGSFKPVYEARYVGFLSWKQKVKGLHMFHYKEAYASNIFNPIDSLYAAFSYPGDDGPIPTVYWEGIREGIDDFKYIKTLENLIEKLSSSNDETVKFHIKEAKAYIKKIQSEIEMDLSKLIFTHPLTGEPVLLAPAWPLDKYDNVRKEIAKRIILLKNASQSKKMVGDIK